MAALGVPFSDVGLVGLVGYAVSVVVRLLHLGPPRVWALRYRIARLLRLPRLHMSTLTVWITVVICIGLVSASAVTLVMVAAGILGLYIVRWPYDHTTFETWTWAGALILLAVLLSILERRVVWIGDPRPDIDAQLIAVQLVVAVIPLTVAAAAAQLAVTWLGIRAAMAVPLGWIVASFFASIVSIAVDLWLFGRGTTGQRSTELAEIMALLVVVAVVLSMVHLIPNLDPESVNARLVHRLNRDWLQRVVFGHGPHVAPQVIARDRFNAVERVVHLASTQESDRHLLQDVLAQLSGRLEELGTFGRQVRADLEIAGPPPEVEIALDLYFAERFQPLIDEVASDKREWVLDYLLRFRGWLERSVERHVATGPNTGRLVSLSSPAIMRRWHNAYPSGLALYGVIIDAAIRNNLGEIAADSIIRAGRYAQRAIGNLPDSKTVSLLQPLGSGRQYSPSDEQFWGLDSYFGCLLEWTRSGVTRKLREVPLRVAGQLRSFYDIAAEQRDEGWMRWLIQTTASTASRVAQVAAESGILAFALPVRFRSFSKANPAELEIAERVASILPDLLLTISGVYSWWSLGMSAMNFTQELLPDFPVQSGAIAAVVVHLESSRRRSDAEQHLMLPVQAVLAQVRGHAGDSRHEFDRAYRDTMRKVAPTPSLLGRLTRRAQG